MAYNGNNKNGSPRISEFKLKEQMCDVGRRIWLKGFCAGNEGNHSHRIGPDRFLCTPTGISKGNLKPDDLCVVDGKGKQISELAHNTPAPGKGKVIAPVASGGKSHAGNPPGQAKKGEDGEAHKPSHPSHPSHPGHPSHPSHGGGNGHEHGGGNGNGS